MKTICITNQKGGVGKTTSTINLAAGLAKIGKRILIIDMDPQYNCTTAFGIYPDREPFNMSDIIQRKTLNQKLQIEDTIIFAAENIDIIPSSKNLKDTEDSLLSVAESYKILNAILKKLKPASYDYCIIDCCPSLGLLTRNALYATDHIIIPCELGSFSIEGIANLLNSIGEYDLEKNPELQKKINILITMFRSRCTKKNVWALEQLAPYNEIIFETKIRDNEALRQSVIEHQSIFDYQKNSNGSKDYNSFVKEFLLI